MKKKILVTTGTRAEYGLLRPLLKKIQDSNKLKLILVVTGTHLSKKHGYTINEIIQDGFKISQKIHMMPMTDNKYGISTELGKSIISFSKCFKKFKPDINIILGDRDEMFASSIAAYHMNIVNVHIHGGDVSGGLDEYTRHAITKISNIHFTASNSSMKRILKMGENPKHVFFSGSPGIDEIKSNNIASKSELEKKIEQKITGDEIILIQHSVTTETHQSENQVLSILKAIIPLKRPIIAIFPNSDAGHKKIFKVLQSFSKKYDHITIFPSLPRKYFLSLLKYSAILVGNSSSGIIESSYLDIPVVNIGTRQQNREHDTNVFEIKSYSSKLISKTIQVILKKDPHKFQKNQIYGKGNSSDMIVKYLEKLVLDDSLIKKQISY